jgi:hypothetical protein
VFFGQVADEQGVQIILARGDHLITAGIGQDIDKTYRLESFQNGIITIRYLPLDTKHTLATGGAP